MDQWLKKGGLEKIIKLEAIKKKFFDGWIKNHKKNN